MAGRIPEDIIDKVRDEVSIEDVVGHFVPLQRKGASFWGRCPFHNEKTPSFHVHPDRQIYYCFGCHRGGNVFRFLMEKEGMAFPEAVEWCAGRIGLDLARFLEDDNKGPDPRGPLLEANKWAAEWFAERMQSSAGSAAREYLQGRGLKPETIESFGLGVAPKDGQEFVKGAEKAKIRPETLLQAQLLRRKEGRAPFAYFRSRLIFPIRGVAQKIHGFGGRILGPGEPKYLNSPETPVFQKRRTLYALPEARSSLVKTSTAILCEGYMDALALHQGGWTNTVATCGTAFTPEQAQGLRRYVERLVLLFDGDAAGLKAAFKSADVALATGLDVRIVRLSGGHDPADLLAAGEVDTLQQAIQEAPGLVECMASEVENRGGARPLKERALHRLRELISRVDDPIRAELLRQEAASAFAVPERLLQEAKPDRRGAPAPAPNPILPQEEGPRADLERELLRLGMAKRTARRLLVETLRAEEFQFARMREIYEALGGVGDDIDAVEVDDLEQVSDEAQSLVARLLLEMPAEGLDATAELQAVLDRLNRHHERERARTHRAQLDEAWRRGDDWQSALRRKAGSDESPADPTDSSQ